MEKIKNSFLSKIPIYKTKYIFIFFIIFIVCFLSYLFLHKAESASLIYTENFIANTHKDASATTGKWDTFLNQARLLGKDWVSMAENMSGAESISTDSNTDKVLLNSIDKPYIIWAGPGLSGPTDIFFTKWTPGVGWTKMDGVTSGSNNLSNSTGQSLEADLAIDNLDNPYVVWWDRTSGVADIFFTKWTVGAGPSVCGGIINDCWTNMAGTVSGHENISNTTGTESDTVQIKLDSANNPYIVWRENILSGEIRIVRWTPAANTWTKMDGTAGYAILSSGLTTNDDPEIIIDTFNNPSVVWGGYAGGNFEIYFNKWTVGAGPGVCGLGVFNCWTNTAGTALGYQNISNSAGGSTNPDFKLDSFNNPYVVWRDGTTGYVDIYFSKWTPAVNAWTQMNGITLGHDNLSNNPGSTELPFLKLDIADNPYVVWSDYTTGNIDIYFSKWTVGAGPGVCGGIINDCWTNMAGTALGYDNVSNDPEMSIISKQGMALDSANNPYLVWDTNLPILGGKFSKWTPGPGWTKMDGTSGYEQIENAIAGNSGMQLDSLNNPYVFSQGPGFAKWLPAYKPALIIQSSNINTYGGNVTKATLNATEILNGQTINYFLSNNGGVTWNPVALGIEHTFTTTGGNLLWQAQLASGNPNITPIIDDLTIDFIAIPSSFPPPPPTAPINLSCQALSADIIRWNFEDTASDETGFKLYGPEGLILNTGDEITTDLSFLDETGLQPNTQSLDRYVRAFNGAGESSDSNTASCYTLANTPLMPIIGEITTDSIILKIDANDTNPNYTEYALKELNSNQYINPDGTFSYTENWQDYEGWGGDNGVIVNGEPLLVNALLNNNNNYNDNNNVNVQFKISLTAGQTYNFTVKAKNGDGVETTFSGSTSSSTESPTPIPQPTPPLILPTPPAILVTPLSAYKPQQIPKGVSVPIQPETEKIFPDQKIKPIENPKVIEDLNLQNINFPYLADNTLFYFNKDQIYYKLDLLNQDAKPIPIFKLPVTITLDSIINIKWFDPQRFIIFTITQNSDTAKLMELVVNLKTNNNRQLSSDTTNALWDETGEQIITMVKDNKNNFKLYKINSSDWKKNKIMDFGSVGIYFSNKQEKIINGKLYYTKLNDKNFLYTFDINTQQEEKLLEVADIIDAFISPDGNYGLIELSKDGIIQSIIYNLGSKIAMRNFQNPILLTKAVWTKNSESIYYLTGENLRVGEETNFLSQKPFYVFFKYAIMDNKETQLNNYILNKPMEPFFLMLNTIEDKLYFVNYPDEKSLQFLNLF
jgi:hypothetical protein